MKTNKLISTILIVIIAILMVTVVLASVQAVDAAPKKVKVTWNANGGKIGKANIKLTTVKKNAKVGRLLKAPVRSGYEFKGWYTKKSGGKRITVATKVKNKVIFHAQWKKKASASDSKLIGQWTYTDVSGTGISYLNYFFYKNGTCKFFDSRLSGVMLEGKFVESNGKISITNFYRIYSAAQLPKEQRGNKVVGYSIGKDDKGEYLTIGNIFGEGVSYSENIPQMKFRK